MLNSTKQIFSLFRKSPDNKVDKTDLKKMLLMAGNTATTAEIEKAIKSIKVGEIEFKEFESMNENLKKRNAKKEDLIAEFQRIENQKIGKIPLNRFVALLRHSNDALTENEIETAIVELLDVDCNGDVHYLGLLKNFYGEDEISNKKYE